MSPGIDHAWHIRSRRLAIRLLFSIFSILLIAGCRGGAKSDPQSPAPSAPPTSPASTPSTPSPSPSPSPSVTQPPDLVQGQHNPPEQSASWAVAQIMAECKPQLAPDATLLRVYTLRTTNKGLIANWSVDIVSPSVPDSICSGQTGGRTFVLPIANHRPGYQFTAAETVSGWRFDSPAVADLALWPGADGYMFDLRHASHHRQTGAHVPENVPADTPIIRVAATPGSPVYAMIDARTGEIVHKTY